jgi:hypothetical protein
MTRAGRCGCPAVALLSIVLVAACGDALGAAHCETNGSGNRQALESLNTLLGKNRDNTAAYLARARTGRHQVG